VGLVWLRRARKARRIVVDAASQSPIRTLPRASEQASAAHLRIGVELINRLTPQLEGGTPSALGEVCRNGRRRRS
jgi:hypothetical protein